MFLRPSLGFIIAQITKIINILSYVFRLISSDISVLFLILFIYFVYLSMQFSKGTYWVLVGNLFEFHFLCYFLSYFALYSCQVCFKPGTFSLPTTDPTEKMIPKQISTRHLVPSRPFFFSVFCHKSFLFPCSYEITEWEANHPFLKPKMKSPV